MFRIWLFCSMVSSCTGCIGHPPYRTESANGTKGANLQADLHQVDEPAQLFDDLIALLGELVGPDDLPTLYKVPTECTTKRHVRTCPNRPFSSYWPTKSKSIAVSFVMCSITACWFSSVPANLEPLGLDTC